RDMPQADRHVWSGFAIRSIECSVFRRMLIDAHGYMEGFLDRSHCAFEPDVESIARPTSHGKAARLDERHYGVKIFLAGAKARREFLRREVLPVGRAGGVVELLQEIFQLGLMAEC